MRLVSTSLPPCFEDTSVDQFSVKCDESLNGIRPNKLKSSLLILSICSVRCCRFLRFASFRGSNLEKCPLSLQVTLHTSNHLGAPRKNQSDGHYLRTRDSFFIKFAIVFHIPWQLSSRDLYGVIMGVKLLSSARRISVFFDSKVLPQEPSQSKIQL